LWGEGVGRFASMADSIRRTADDNRNAITT
jgi:hypothetical protein